MWLLDWGMRLYELKERLDGKVSAMGKGWYCLSLPLPRRRLDGCACTSPLAHFYIHHSDSSVRELHPFTTITHLASQNAIIPGKEDDLPIQFLFRKSGKSDAGDLPVAKDGFMTAFGLSRRKRPAKIQWTNKLAGLVDQSEHGMSYTTASVTLGPLDLVTPGKQSSMVGSWPEYFRLTADVSLRLEGPYFTPADPAQYETVVCFVAGTGVSGAIAIAQAFTELERGEANALPGRKPESGDSPNTLLSPSTRTWQKCVINWSVRADDCLDVPAFKAHSGSALEVRVHLTGTGRKRLDMEETLASSCKQSREGSIWVYLSGPPQFIEAGEKACKAAPGVDWYGARWDI
ncbi:MAG: hypothetical protein M1833_006090 [Piccolia ochrophora]|nr:MAG: hypothetical protein M1833_006090 [Piccolia ochrophora]